MALRASSLRSSARPFAFLLATAAAVIILDQVLKAVVTGALENRPPISLLHGLVLLDYTRNSGAAFGIFRTGGSVFVVVAVVVSLAILLYFPRISRPAPFLILALGFILGGAIGNLLDRVRLGYVVDFVDLRWWPVFNLADSAIVVGVLLLVIRSAFPPRAASS